MYKTKELQTRNSYKMPSCQEPQSHIVDSYFYSRGYTTAEARRVFCGFRRLQRWLDVEACLATCQADLGMIPHAAALELKQSANLANLDIEAVKEDITRTGHSLIPLLNAWQNSISPESAQFIHYGATTQDIQDTAQSLEIKDALAIINRDLTEIVAELAGLTIKYQGLPMIGRTHGQHALPTTLGLKMAVWLDELLRHDERLDQCSSRLLVSQLFGGVGTMDAFGDKGPELLAAFSAQIGLTPPASAWHSSRDRIAEFLSILALLCGTLAKIANEIAQLARDEIRELEEPFHMGKIGSTTMPHKRNPELCEQVVVLAKLVKSCAGIGLDGLINEHERDYRAVRLEWVSLTDASLFTCGALHLTKTILKGLIVNREKIELNLTKSACLISTEALMFLFGNKIGKHKAHKLLYDLSMTARNTGQSLIDLLMTEPLIKDNFTRDEIEDSVRPDRHIGISSQLTEKIIDQTRSWLTKAALRPALISECPLAGRLNSCPGSTQQS